MIRLGPYAALGWRFVVETRRGVLADQVERVLASLRASGSGAEHTYVLLPPDGGSGELIVDGKRLVASQHEWTLYARLLWHLNVQVVQHTTDHVLLHASAASQGAQAVIMAAPMESGKTTLVAGLIQAGLDYLTDEATAINPETGTITPFPKALSIEVGSWDVLADLRPTVPSEATHLQATQWQVDPRTIRPRALGAAGSRPHVVIFPRYAPRTPTRLEPVSPGRGLITLLQCTFELRRQRERDMRLLAAVVEEAACYELSMHDLPSAVSAVLLTLDA